MRRTSLIFILIVAPAFAAIVDEPIDITGNLIKATLQPDGGGSLSAFGFADSPNPMAGEDGLIVEGFGVPNPYVPSRRLNEKLEVLEEYADRPVIRYSYDCQGPNIDGLHVTRLMELFPDEASVRVTWTIANNGQERQWVAPWIRSSVTPGGKVGPEDRADVPTQYGIINADDVLFHPASRNWVAVTDGTTKEAYCAIFHAAHTHSFLIARDEDYPAIGVQASFVPRLMKPGDTWETKYRVAAVRGLTHIDYASEELAAQVDYSAGKLIILMAPTRAFPGMTIHPQVIAENGRVWDLPAKKFDLLPGKLVRATYDWQPPADGNYNLIAKVKQNGNDYMLGAETGSPNGAIDTQVAVGAPVARTMKPWTSAPNDLEHSGRTLERAPLSANGLAAWVESPLYKVYREDKLSAKGSATDKISLSLAQNERESTQIVLRPAAGRALFGAYLEIGDLTEASGKGTLSADNTNWYQVGYVPVRVPTHYEGPTGLFPDPLLPVDNTDIDAGVCTPLWITVYAPEGTAPGTYRGPVTLHANGEDPIVWQLEVKVHGFALPNTPALSTDFGLDTGLAAKHAKARGGSGGEALLKAYRDDAFAHRVTLRETAELPTTAAGITAFGPRVRELSKLGATTYSVPLPLIDDPAALKEADELVRATAMASRAFVQLAETPPAPAWPKLLEQIKRWKAAAPSIAPMITTAGISPFIPEDLARWCVQVPVFDTGAGKYILEQTMTGREVWWYVDHMPPRPYGNFFVDFTGMEHRMLFWQAFALGVRGVHYWSVNYSQPGQDPYNDLSDATPVNGDGMLVYPGANGPVPSMRWEIIRDGIEDYDYFALLMDRRTRLKGKGGQDALLSKAAQVYNLGPLVPDLVNFSRDPAALDKKRAEVAAMIEEMDRALAR